MQRWMLDEFQEMKLRKTKSVFVSKNLPFIIDIHYTAAFSSSIGKFLMTTGFIEICFLSYSLALKKCMPTNFTRTPYSAAVPTMFTFSISGRVWSNPAVASDFRRVPSWRKWKCYLSKTLFWSVVPVARWAKHIFCKILIINMEVYVTLYNLSLTRLWKNDELGDLTTYAKTLGLYVWGMGLQIADELSRKYCMLFSVSELGKKLMERRSPWPRWRRKEEVIVNMY